MKKEMRRNKDLDKINIYGERQASLPPQYLK